jgi:hypothetical protein
MPKLKKTPTAKAPRSARTGDFTVARQAVSSTISASKIRDAVRKVNQLRADKK